jgi:hypothetical protein
MDAFESAPRRIVNVLRQSDVPHQPVSGLAARAYGARRPLADLDFYIPEARLEDMARAAGKHVARPPAHHRDECWDLVFMKIVYEDREVELAGAERARFFARTTGCWCDAEIAFDASVEREILGVRVPVMPLQQLIAYKRALGRDVDHQDVAEMTLAADRPTRPEKGR